ncbi:hypothetical protein KFK09_018094 [Dendrobium nobile]|uniref:Pentatricopeptide repeat-containing protein n=1 Tax=Dendrobium nobile TaxID=94219 RepID=A0A8T3ATE2_DENNO|nr:hypothetical protein KFK09_018094 [Dendrobium nobile]
MNLLHLRTSPVAISSPLAFRQIYLKAKRKKAKTRQLKSRRSADGIVSLPGLPYPKSSPTPLLIPETSTALTRDEALERIFLDLHSALAGGVRVEPSTFSSLLELCYRIDPSPRRAAALHRLVPASLLHSSPNLSSKLIRLYASCGLVEQAHNLFDNVPRSHKAVAFPWNALISGYADAGLHEDAMALYHQMEEEDVEPDRFTFPRVIKACAGLGSVPHCEYVHRHLVRSGFATDPFALNALVDMYAKCGDIARARRIFDQIPDRDPIAWNSMLNGYIRHGLFPEAIETCRRMLVAGFEPDTVTVSSLLAGCASANCNIGLEIHGWVLRRGLQRAVSVANSLITMYSVRGQLAQARFIFNSMPEKDLVSWNAIISANRRDRRVLSIFRQMLESGMVPDDVTFVSLLSACANLGLVEDGRKLFDEMQVRHGIKPGMEHYGCMVNLLGRAGLVEEAFELVSRMMPFDGGPTVWGALLYACSVHRNVTTGETAAERLFELEPDNEHNFELLRRIYSDAGRLEDVERVEKLMRDRGLECRS